MSHFLHRMLFVEPAHKSIRMLAPTSQTPWKKILLGVGALLLVAVIVGSVVFATQSDSSSSVSSQDAGTNENGAGDNVTNAPGGDSGAPTQSPDNTDAPTDGPTDVPVSTAAPGTDGDDVPEYGGDVSIGSEAVCLMTDETTFVFDLPSSVQCVLETETGTRSLVVDNSAEFSFPVGEVELFQVATPNGCAAPLGVVLSC